ncbi:MAG: LPD1 domain-containing protein [Novipirellula sp. JB048]
MTREKLLRNEPHQISDHVEKSPATALALALVVKGFPPKPEYRKSRYASGADPKKIRKDYVDAYQAVISEANKIAASGQDDYLKAISQMEAVVRREIYRLREGTEDEHGVKRRDSYNQTANQLVSYHKRLNSSYRKTSFNRVMREAVAEIEKSGDKTIQDVALSVLEGATLPSAMGKSSSRKKFDVAAAYVSHAERAGGPPAPAKSATEATAYMVGKVGLRGVQFGNSVTDKEREHHATMAASALLDLADVTGLPIDAISLGGNLGLAIGARGRAGALAHYEPDSRVINLTRKKGVGSLAHEWAHAFDHELNGGKGAMFSNSVRVETKFERIDGAYVSSPNEERSSKVGKAMLSVQDAFRSSGFFERMSTHVNENKLFSPKEKQYWKSELEMFARCFERHVQAKLEGNSRKNTYLSGIETKSYKSGGLWPTDDEVKKMEPAFDALMDAYRTDRLGVADRVKYSTADRHAFIMRYLAETRQQYRAADANSAKGESQVVTGSKGDRGHFVTIDGHPVFIEASTGKINRGPRHMKGKHAKTVPGRRTTRSKRIQSDRSGDRDSPGQIGAFGDGFGGDLVRSTKTQSKLNLDAKGPPKFKPITRIDHAIVDEVGDDPEDVDFFRELMGDAHQMLSSEAEDTNHDLRQLLSNFGYSGKKTSQIVQAVRRSHNKGGDADHIPKFDEMVDMARRSYPHLLATHQGESFGAGDDESALYDRLKQGFEKPVTKTDPAVLKLAREMFDARGGGQGHDYDYDYDASFDPDDEWAPKVKPEEDPDFVPFSVPFSDVLVERFQAAFLQAKPLTPAWR